MLFLVRRALAIAFVLLVSTANADERMADVAAHVNAVWFAEEYNKHCPESPIEVPVPETKLRQLLVKVDGGNFVDDVAVDPRLPDMNFRDDMKAMAEASTTEGCGSETALMLRSRVEQELAIPDLIAELLSDADADQ